VRNFQHLQLAPVLVFRRFSAVTNCTAVIKLASLGSSPTVGQPASELVSLLAPQPAGQKRRAAIVEPMPVTNVTILADSVADASR
jgi:hypothetical protein